MNRDAFILLPATSGECISLHIVTFPIPAVNTVGAGMKMIEGKRNGNTRTREVSNRLVRPSLCSHSLSVYLVTPVYLRDRA